MICSSLNRRFIGESPLIEILAHLGLLLWGWLTGICVVLTAVFFGINITSPEFQTAARHTLMTKLLDREPILIGLSCFLLASASLLAVIWSHSETITFIPDSAINLQIHKLKKGKAALLGISTVEKPVTKRCLNGSYAIRFSAEGFDSQERFVDVRGSGFGLNERRMVIDLPLCPTFSLHTFHSYPEDVYGEPSEGPHYPAELKDAFAATVAFTIASSSPTPIRIQDVFIQVVIADPLKQSTFPISEGGGNGVTPVIGWVALRPHPGLYPILSNNKRNVGKDTDPADFYVRAFCHSGVKFKVGVELNWMDLRHQNRIERFTFVENYELNLPEMVEWQDLAAKAKQLRMFFSVVDVYFLYLRFQRVQSISNFSVLASTSDDFKKDEVAKYKEAICISDNHVDELAKAIRGHKDVTSRNPVRHFIIVDDTTLLLQASDDPRVADIITDKELISSLIQIYDQIAQRYASIP
jgi:hypothetical protein